MDVRYIESSEIPKSSPIAGKQSPLAQHLMKSVGKGDMGLASRALFDRYVALTPASFFIKKNQEISFKAMRSILGAVDKDPLT